MTVVFDESCFSCIPDVVREDYYNNWHATGIVEGKSVFDFYVSQEIERRCYINSRRYFTLQVVDIEGTFIYLTQNSVVE